jgi:hypothetical protein
MVGARPRYQPEDSAHQGDDSIYERDAAPPPRLNALRRRSGFSSSEEQHAASPGGFPIVRTHADGDAHPAGQNRLKDNRAESKATDRGNKREEISDHGAGNVPHVGDGASPEIGGRKSLLGRQRFAEEKPR